jgi:hypothetical protein
MQTYVSFHFTNESGVGYISFLSRSGSRKRVKNQINQKFALKRLMLVVHLRLSCQFLELF